MKRIKKLILFACFFALSAAAAMAQNSVSGTVKDAKGEPLIGASVAVKGTSGGTVTDVDGNFTVSAPQGAALIVSYTGFEPIEFLVSGSRAEIVLAENTKVMNEVVVVGYGNLTKKQVTGAIASVRGDELKKQPLLTPIQGVQGLAAGIQVIGTGEPGKQPRVQIRGINTILTNENPLYVVDGVITDDITNINGADVLSIDVLKDGAAAIYGTRAGNGVILITTKKGQEGKMKVSFDSYRGYRRLINRVQMASAKFYADYTNEARAYDGQSPAFPDIANLKYDTDWFDEITQNGVVQSHTVTFSGGSKNTTNLFSAGYFSDEGVLKGAKFDRISLRSNNELRPFSFLKIGNVLTANITKSDNKSAGSFSDAYRVGPTVFVRDSNGVYGSDVNVSVPNPVAGLELANDFSKGNRFQGSLYGEAEPIKGLTFRSSWGFDKIGDKNTQFTPIYRYGTTSNTETRLRLFNSDKFYWVWDNTLRFQKNIGNDHSLELLAGHSAERDAQRSNAVRVTGVPADENLWYISQGDPTTVVYIQGDDRGGLLTRESFFGRANYSLFDRYNLSATLRRDGSSAFPESEQWGNFYSIGGSWIVSEEAFMKNSAAVDYLKIRGGWALLGNDNISRIVNNDLSQLLSVSNTDPYGLPGGLVAGITINQLKDAAATWETTKSFDTGVEFGLFDHITGEISYYNKLTAAFVNVPTPSVVDPNGILSKAADVRNKGLELSLKWTDEISRDFSYRIGGNATFNRNNVEAVRGALGDITEGGLGNGHVTTKTVVGQPIGSFWVFQTDGIFSDTAQINSTAHFTGDKPGDFRYKDVNGDGILDDKDRVFVGAYQPKIFYGINLGLNWKSLDFAIDCYGNAGNKVYNGKKGIRFGNENIEASRQGRWRDYAQNDAEPRASNTIPKPSTYFIESGDFFRINNITLGYTIAGAGLKKAGISRARLFASAQNPVIFKKFSGFTPELPGSNALNSGIELFVYPSVATFMAGFNLNFN